MPGTQRRGFSNLRKRSTAGDPWARARLRAHAERRLQEGWATRVVAKRLGLCELELFTLLRPTATSTAPRLIRK